MSEDKKISEMSHHRSSKEQKEYVKAIIHNLSLRRLSDTEITDYLKEKGILLARTTVNGITKSEQEYVKNMIHRKKQILFTSIKDRNYDH